MPAKQFSNQISDDEIEFKIHSFVVKIWLDNRDLRHGTLTWRGHITHVTTSKRLYIQRLVDIISFILPYLQEMGAKVSLYWRFLRWVSRKKKHSVEEGGSYHEYYD